jgi:hypothetical protein
MEFKRVTSADADRFRLLVEAYWSELMPDAETVKSSAARDTYFSQRFPFAAEPRIYWGIIEGDPVGFISLSITGKTALINDFYVVPEKRRQGYGFIVG